eukprot:183277-Rhodomonas_salina.3
MITGGGLAVTVGPGYPGYPNTGYPACTSDGDTTGITRNSYLENGIALSVLATHLEACADIKTKS